MLTVGSLINSGRHSTPQNYLIKQQFQSKNRFTQLSFQCKSLKFTKKNSNLINLRSNCKNKAISCVSQADQILPQNQDERINDDKKLVNKINKIIGFLTNLFPVWVALCGVIAMINPNAFDWFSMDYLPLALGLTMISMGTSLKIEDFTSVFKSPKKLLVGLVLQYSIMPLLGFLISRYPGVPIPFAAGVVLVACCPGGTASNIVTYIAKADVALSVSMTAVSTIAAVVFTPFLTSKLLGTLVAVDAAGLFFSTAQVVLFPITVGVILNEKFPRFVDKTRSVSPLIAVIVVALICGTVFAQSVKIASTSVLSAAAMVYVLHTGGFFLGYMISKLLKLPTTTCRTISIEVGMQNSTLGAVLAGLHFADPLTALPCAISAGTHSIIGSLMAAYWSRQPKKQDQQ